MGQAPFRALAGIVLAGGRSERMGRPKALLQFPATGRTFVRQVTDTLRDAGLTRLAVVTGAHHRRIAEEMRGSGVDVLYNPDHADGQLSSLLRGLRWAFAEPGGDWALSTLVDVPGLARSTVVAVAAANRSARVRAIRPAIGDRHGHPIAWHREAVTLLEATDPACGARPVLSALADRGAVLDVPIDDPGGLIDVDTPADYARLLNEP